MKDIISMSALSSEKIGKGFGNKFFQYGFLKTYAKKHKLQAEAPKWIGRYLFDCKDPYISSELPVVKQISPNLKYDLIPNAKKPYKNVDFRGYFQYHTQYYAPYKDYFCSLFQPKPEIQVSLDKIITTLRSKGKTIIGLHLRRGDYSLRSEEHYFIPPNSWYIDWLNNIWDTLEAPVLFIASDEPHKVLSDFHSFHPITSIELGAILPKAIFYPDFYILTQCNMVAISNSTFSFAACMLNDQARVFMRPYPPKLSLVPFDPWNSDVLYRTDYHTKRYFFK